MRFPPGWPVLHRGASSAPTPTEKYIIQFGGVRTPAQFLASQVEIQTNEFNGGVMRIQGTDATLGGLFNLDQQVSVAYSIPYAVYATSLTTTQSITFTQWTQNFLLLNVARPGTANLADAGELASFVNNISVAAQVAEAAGFVGVVLDMEAYDSSIFWSYPDQPAGPTFADRQADYVAAGEAVIAGIEAAFGVAAAQVVIAVSYEQLKNTVGAAALEASRYGLLPSFLDGLHNDATTAKLICLCEEAYVNTTAADMDADIALQTPPTVPWLGSANYANVHLDGLATWLDAAPPTFSYTDVESNYFTPAGFRNALELMLARVDKYCFVYTNSATRWPGMVPAEPTDDEAVPAEYVAVLNAVNS